MNWRLTCGVLAALTAACAPGDQTGPDAVELNSAGANAIGSVTITPAQDTITSMGGSVQLAATVRDQAGKVIPPSSASVQWSTLNGNRVSVSSTGRVTGKVASGQARVIAQSGGRADTALISLMTVASRPPSATASTITAAPTPIAPGSGTATITVVALDSAGQPIANASVSLSVSGTGNTLGTPAPTNASGQTTASFSSSKPETKTITATVNGVTLAQSATIVVRDPDESVNTVMQCTIPAVPAPSAINLALDQVYNTSGGASLKLDVAWPKTPGLHPLVFVVHGGGWFQGDKSDFRSEIQMLAGLGYTAVAVNYRLVNGSSNIFPAAIQDLRCALRWLRKNSSRYAMDANRGAVVGNSAGAHLAELLGTAYDATKLDGSCGTIGAMATLQAVVAMSGPSDLRQSSFFNSQSLPAVSAFLGGSPESVPARAASASPVAYATLGDMPTLVIHGATDPVIAPAHSSSLKTALNAAGVPATYILLSGKGHNLSLRDGSAAGMPGSCTAFAFLDQELQP